MEVCYVKCFICAVQYILWKIVGIVKNTILCFHNLVDLLLSDPSVLSERALAVGFFFFLFF